MKVIIIAFFLLAIVGCGRVIIPFYSGPDTPHYIDPYFNPLIERFKKDADAHGVGYGGFDNITVMKIGNSQDIGIFKQEISACNYYNDSSDIYHNFYKEIIFTPELLTKNKDDQYRDFLHEIGHCAYHLPHNNTNPKFIMYYINYDFMYPGEEKFYIDEYFSEAYANQQHWGDESNPT